MSQFRFLWLVCLLVFCIPTFASAAPYTIDLGVRGEDLTFDPSTFVVGQTIRVYATVHNFGTKDTRGSVLFFQGAAPIGDEQPISVRAGGFADEVFADFTVPSGPFNILVRVRGTAPADQNAANDEALSRLITPIADMDRDGVGDEKDNCLKVANTDQADMDRDGVGNACDDDDDNDGVSDTEEAIRGTSPMSPDTDGDGVTDSKDAYPLDPVRSKIEVAKKTEPVVAKPVAVKPTEKKELPKLIPVAEAKEAVVADLGSTEIAQAQTNVPAAVTKTPSVHAAITTERKNWNTFTFAATGFGAPKNAQYFWEFGDGGGAEGKDVSHTYKSTGDYTTILTVKDGSSQVTRDTVPISVSFWNFANPKVWVLVGLLGIVILWMLGVLLRK